MTLGGDVEAGRISAEATQAEGIRRLYELMRRVNSSADLAAVLDEIARGVVEVLGYGVAAIARLDRDAFVMTAVAGDDEARTQILGRRTPLSVIFDEFAHADEWGVLRFVPHDRIPNALEESAWVPEFVPEAHPDAWHPLDALYAPLYSATGELLGNMSVDLPPGNRIPNPEERELLEMFVVQAGVAMDNAQQRERLEERVRLGQAVQRVAAAGELGDLQSTLSEASRVMGELLDAGFVRIRVFPDGDSGANAAAVEGADDVSSFPRGGPADEAELMMQVRRLAQVAWARGRSLVGTMSDPTGGLDLGEPATTRIREELAEHGGGSVLLTAIGVGRQFLGYVVMVRGPRVGDWTTAELDATREMGLELGRAVYNARLFHRERQLVRELKDLDQYRRDLIATISHEFKTPLTTIMGHVELIEDLDTGIASVGAISRNIERLDRLVQNLLTFSRVQEDSGSARTRVDLTTLGEQSLDLLAMAAERGGVAVLLTVPDEPVVVLGEADELAKVVNNLAHNAVKYTRPGGHVTLEVRADGEYAEVCCTDDGLGISETDQEHLFAAFHRSSDPEALSIPGTGLGLAISRRIARLHGGDIEVESRLGEGSTFRLRLPLQRDGR